jgi:hypothetical protein
MSKQPRDDANQPIPVLSFRPGGAQTLTLSDSSTRSAAFAPSVRVISLFSDADCRFELGDGSVSASATSHFLPAGLYIDVSLGSDNVPSANARYLAVIGTSGTLHISERE